MASEDSENCILCHNSVIETQKAAAVPGNCLVCHNAHNAPAPSIEGGGEYYHNVHSDITKGNPSCAVCHRVPSCANCHASHTGIDVNRTCESCHGGLPSPKGHTGFREYLKGGKHSWMRTCSACHAGNNLSFSNIYFSDISKSDNLCKICHSTQMKKMEVGTHGTEANKCVDCHEPHTTSAAGILNKNETKTNWLDLNTSTEFIKKSVEGMPLFNNTYLLLILCLIFASAVFEHLLTRHEKGQIIMTDNIKVTHDEVFSKVLEVVASDMNFLESILPVLKSKEVNILGTTIKNISGKYRFVLFLDLPKIGVEEMEKIKEEVLKDIESAGAISVQYSERYEI